MSSQEIERKNWNTEIDKSSERGPCAGDNIDQGSA